MANFSDIINASLDLVVPHARREPLNPMAYVRDINEWFVPAAQMALDQMEGTERYTPASYVLASLPVVGKVSKTLAKAAKHLTKAQKAERIIKTNPMVDDYHTGIRNVEDVLDFNEARQYTLNDIGDVSSYPDVTQEILDNAAKTRKIRLYSSRPFSVGSFVSPSKMQAQDYAGNGKIYEDVFDIDDIAWLNADEGQIARLPK